jgi:hypothetical protein
MLNKRILFLLILCFSINAHAIKIPQEKKPPVPELYEKIWEKTYGERDDDIAHDVLALENGHSAIVGTCKSFDDSPSQICVMRMNERGEILWRLLLGGDKADEGRAISRALDGSLYILGTTKSLAKDYDKDIYVAKITQEGKVLWENALGGNRDEVAGGIVGPDDGGAMIVGQSESFGDSYGDIYMAKVNADGKKGWVEEQFLSDEPCELED